MKEARRLGIPYKKEQGWLKAVNLESTPIFCIAQGVKVSLGDWCDALDFPIVVIDYYPMVLDMDFFL